MTLVVFLAAALLCTPSRCYPALVGPDTPIGQFPIVRRYVRASGYGGDLLQFSEASGNLYAIHRVWLGNAKERRLDRLTSEYPADRRLITHGCINVMPEI